MTDGASTTETTTVLSTQEKTERIAKLDGILKEAVTNLLETINAHNSKVALIKRAAAEKSDPLKLLQEIREDAEVQSKDPELKKIMTKVETFQNQIEKLIKEANELAKKHITQPADEAEVTAAQAAVKQSSTEIRESKAALKMLEGLTKTELIALLPEVDSTRGIRVTSSEGEVSRARLSKIWLEDEPIYKEVTTTKNGQTFKEDRATISLLSQVLTQKCKVPVSATEITVEFLKSQNLASNEFDKITAGGVIPWTFSKDIFDDNGKQIDTKHFNLKFQK